jgi:hypothetical protein
MRNHRAGNYLTCTTCRDTWQICSLGVGHGLELLRNFLKAILSKISTKLWEVILLNSAEGSKGFARANHGAFRGIADI